MKKLLLLLLLMPGLMIAHDEQKGARFYEEFLKNKDEVLEKIWKQYARQVEQVQAVQEERERRVAIKKFPYLNTFLADSELTKACNEESKNWSWTFKSKRCKACEGLDAYLKKCDSPEKTVGGFSPFEVGFELLNQKANSEHVKELIRAVLPKESDDTKWKEYHDFSEAIVAVKKHYKKQQEEAKKEREAKEQYEKEHPRF